MTPATWAAHPMSLTASDWLTTVGNWQHNHPMPMSCGGCRAPTGSWAPVRCTVRSLGASELGNCRSAVGAAAELLCLCP